MEEYKVLKANDYLSLEGELNTAATDGWVFVQFERCTTGASYVAIMKRPVTKTMDEWAEWHNRKVDKVA